MRLKKRQASPLTPMHVAGLDNAMTDIPSRSFGSKPEWHCRDDVELLTLMNAKFPLPKQKSWTVFRLSSAISTRVLSVLRMKHTTLDEWRRLPVTGKFSGEIGAASSQLWEWTLSFRRPRTASGSVAFPASLRSSERDTSAGDARSELEEFRRRFLPLARRSPWPQELTL